MTDLTLPDHFDWSELDDSLGFIQGEIFGTRIYDYWVQVKEGDIVVDIGASVGPFTYTAFRRGAKKVYAVEPSTTLLKTLIKNNSEFLLDKPENPLICINRAICDKTSNETTIDDSLNIFGNDKSFKSLSFKDFISQYNIEYIDFLKIDCEGGEYSIFTEENMEFLTTRVKFIACEIHARTIPNGYEKFIYLRDNILVNLNCQIRSGRDPNTGFPIDIIPFIYDEEIMKSILSKTEPMIWIHN